MRKVSSLVATFSLTLLLTLTLFATSIYFNLNIVPCTVTSTIKGGVVPRIAFETPTGLQTMVDINKLNELTVPAYSFSSMCSPSGLTTTRFDYSSYGNREEFNIFSVAVLILYPLIIGVILWIIFKKLSKNKIKASK